MTHRPLFSLLAFVVIALSLSSCASTKNDFSISGSFPASGTIGTAYSATLTAKGGDGGDTWTVTGLPPGVTAPNTSSNVLTATGTPTTPGTYSISATVQDAKGDTKTYAASVTIAGQSLSISPSSLNNFTAGQSISGVTFTASPATTGPYTWTVTSGSLPDGLMLSNGTVTSPNTIQSTTNTITIGGTAASSGAYFFTLSVADSFSPTPDSGAQPFSGVTYASTTACAGAPLARGNESTMSAPYAFVLQGADFNNEPVAYAGSFTPDGNGGIAAASVDYLDAATGAESFNVNLAYSSYSFGNDGRGCLYLVFQSAVAATHAAHHVLPQFANAAASHSPHRNAAKISPDESIASSMPIAATFSFALVNSNATGRITEFDEAGITGAISAGSIHAQSPSAFSLAALSSNFAFGLSGWYTVDAQMLDRASLAGSFADAAGTVTNGYSDANIAGNYLGEQTNGGGSLSLISTSSGRGTGTYTVSVSGTPLTFDFAYYVVNANDYFIISTDDPTAAGNFLVSGRAVAASATASPLNAYYLAGWSGIDLAANGDDGEDANYASIATMQLASDGTIPTMNVYSNDAGSFQSAQYSGSYVLDPAGSRAAISGFTTPPVAYLAAPNQDDGIAGFLVGSDAFTSAGLLAFQTAGPPNYDNSTLGGNLVIGSSDDPTARAGSFVAIGSFDGNGEYSVTFDSASGRRLDPDDSDSTTYLITASGAGAIQNENIFFVTNGGLLFAIDESTEPLLYISPGYQGK